jgi:ferrous iron transport protein B
VSSLALIFKVTGEGDTIQSSMVRAMKDAKIEDTGQKLFTPATIAGLIIFFLFALQCLSTVAVSRKETGGWRIPVLQLIIFTSMAYALTFITVNGLRALGIA